MVVIILLASIASLCYAADFANVGFSSQSGLHHESIGEVRFITSELKLVTYIDLDKLISQRPLITQQMIENTYHTCEDYIPNEACENIIYHENLEAKNAYVENYMNHLRHFINESITNKSRYVQSINNSLMPMIRTGLHRFHDDLDGFRNKSATRARDMQEAFQKINKNKGNDTAPYILRVYNSIRGWVQCLEMELDHYIHLLETIIDVISSAKTDVIHLQLFTSENLEKVLNQYVAKNQSSVFPLENDELLSDNLLKISKTNVELYDGKLSVVTNVPLLSPIVYNLYKMYPYPVLQIFGNKRGSAYIEPKADHLLLARDFYALANAEDLVDCKTIDEYHYICDTKFPLHDTTLQPICETTTLVTDRQFLPPFINCNIKLSLTFNSYWRKSENGWLYSIPAKEEVNVWCDGRLKDVMNISGAGILQLRRGCQASTPYMTMIGFQTKNVDKPVEYIDVWNLNVTTLVHKRKCLNHLPRYYIQLDEFLHECEGNHQEYKPHSVLFVFMPLGLLIVGLELMKLVLWPKLGSAVALKRFRETAV